MYAGKGLRTIELATMRLMIRGGDDLPLALSHWAGTRQRWRFRIFLLWYSPARTAAFLCSVVSPALRPRSVAVTRTDLLPTAALFRSDRRIRYIEAAMAIPHSSMEPKAR